MTKEAGVRASEWHALSERQRQCLELVGRGLSSKEIARELGVSPSTVDNHIQYALTKLGLATRKDAVRLMVQMTSAHVEAADVYLGGNPQLPSAGQARRRRWLDLPPIGGVPNEGSASTRVTQLISIALLTVMLLIAAIISIAGAVRIAQLLI